MIRTPATDLYEPGNVVPQSGIYRVLHYQHRLPHEITAMKGDAFPQFRRCGARVRFELLHAATRLRYDHDFEF